MTSNSMLSRSGQVDHSTRQPATDHPASQPHGEGAPNDETITGGRRCKGAGSGRISPPVSHDEFDHNHSVIRRCSTHRASRGRAGRAFVGRTDRRITLRRRLNWPMTRRIPEPGRTGSQPICDDGPGAQIRAPLDGSDRRFWGTVRPEVPQFRLDVVRFARQPGASADAGRQRLDHAYCPRRFLLSWSESATLFVARKEFAWPRQSGATQRSVTRPPADDWSSTPPGAMPSAG